MVILPAIDLKEGRCVRLEQGKPDREKVYSGDPAEVARGWERQGAQWLHVVDLDGAFLGEPQNLHQLKSIRSAVNIPIQFGGGVRTLEILETLFSIGTDRVVLGTVALESPELLRQACDRYASRIVVGIDARNGKVAVKGWHDVTAIDALDFGARVAKEGVELIVYTDIARDGMLVGPNKGALKRMTEEVPISIIASGGVSSLADVAEIRNLAPHRIVGMIIGKALYEGSFKLKEAIDIAATNG